MKNLNPYLKVYPNGKTFVNLPEGKRKKIYIGRFYVNKHTFYTITKSKKHLFKKLNSYAFPLDLPKIDKKLWYICLKLQIGKTLIKKWTSIYTLRKQGIIKQFKPYEPQLFLPYPLFKDSKAEARRERKEIKKREGINGRYTK